MPTEIKISQTVQGLLRCPVCHNQLRYADEQFVCLNPQCDTHFPVVNGIPIFLNEESSVFSINDFVSQRSTFFKDTHENKLTQTVRRLMPSIDKNINGKENYEQMAGLLLKQSNTPRVLVIGGSIIGSGLEALIDNPAIDLVESDVSLGPRTMLICDAHDIPLEDKSFDGVIVQAVLEHVVDPYRCVGEIYRVLKEQGLVYSETPFMQQVHGRQYDFTRFTYLGHRRLFRNFEEINSGAVCGPGMALAWSYRYFLLSFLTSKTLRGLARVFSSLTSFYLKYFDSYLINKPGTLDAASGFYFIGRKSDYVLSDKELIQLYKGAS